MLSDPRSITFAADLIQPQLPLRKEGIQRLYGRLAEETALAYANINMGAGGAQLSTVHGAAEYGEPAQSALAFGPDRVQFREEWPRLSVDDFCDRTRRRLAILMEELAIPVFSVAQCTVRCLVNARGFADSRALVSEVMGCTLDAGFRDFERAPNLLGLRLTFPGTPQDPAAHSVRVESFGRDPRALFIEEVRVANLALKAEDLEPFEDAFRAAYDFLTDRVAAWVARVGGGDE
ncbi:MAG: hypothetical protein R3F20_17705 [Planctomycetota bacterium]